MKLKKSRAVLLALAFLLPNLAGFLIFTAGPVVFSMLASLTNWNLQQTVRLRLIGLHNFASLSQDENFWRYLINTAYMMIGLPLAIFGSLGLALLLSQKLKGMTVYRTLFYLPSFTSGVALMILWKALYNPDFGLINVVLGGIMHFLHIPGSPPEWLLSTKNLLGLSVEHVGFDRAQFGLGARDALVIMGVWTAIGGNNMLLYLAALTSVPEELYEAARVDGARPWTIFWRITWPQLAPTTFFIVVVSLIGGFQSGFEQARVMTGGGPAGSTTTVSYYIYTKAFEQFQMGYASAIAWVLFLIIFIVTVLNWRFSNREGASADG